MKKEVNTALWLRRVWGWRTRKSERYVNLHIPIFYSFTSFIQTHLHAFVFLFNFLQLSSTLIFASPSPASTIRASAPPPPSAPPLRKSLLQRVLSHITCSNNVPEVHDEIIIKTPIKTDDDDHSLLIYTVRGRGRAEVNLSKSQWPGSE